MSPPEITIQPVTNMTAWNNFVLSCDPHTFLHSWEWGQVQLTTGEEVVYLGIYDKQNIIQGVALVVIVHARRGRHYLIPHGPLTANQNGTFYQELLVNLVHYFRSRAKSDGAVALRICPLLVTSPESRHLYKELGFRPAPLHVHAELTWILDINKLDEELLAGMRKTTRHAIRKASKMGVIASVISDPQEILRRFWPLYEQTRNRHGFVLWPKAMVKAQVNIFSKTDRLFAVVARYQNQDVAMAILPHFGDTVFYYHGASQKLPSSVPAAQLVQWAAIQEAKKRGATRYNFWGITEQQSPPHPFTGITTFKKGFGGYAKDYLHAQDLPLSRSYWKLWAIDLFRKYRRGF
jgi:lipid II:glycine glycyltransferase (peptidoglycan interpeptide bridge formation enzyme)